MVKVGTCGPCRTRTCDPRRVMPMLFHLSQRSKSWPVWDQPRRPGNCLVEPDTPLGHSELARALCPTPRGVPTQITWALPAVSGALCNGENRTRSHAHVCASDHTSGATLEVVITVPPAPAAHPPTRGDLAASRCALENDGHYQMLREWTRSHEQNRLSSLTCSCALP